MRSITDNNTGRLSKILGRRKGLRLDRSDLSISLLEAVRHGREDCITSLLAAGADTNYMDEEGKPALYLLLEKSGANPNSLRELLRARADPDLATDDSRQVALHVAAKRGYQVCVTALVGARGQPDIQDVHGNTPLMYAAREGHLTIVKSLIREGVDVNNLNGHGESAVHFACSNGHTAVVQALLESYANPNYRDHKGQTPLLIATKAGHLEILELLLQHRCDINSQDNHDGRTVLHWAVESKHAPLVEKIIHMNAIIDIKDKNWDTPFMLALKAGSDDIIHCLMKAGCNVTIPDRSFNTALHVASKDGRTSLILPFIKAGLDINIKGSGGVTALMFACLGGHYEIVHILLRHGANVDMKDRHRATPLIYALMSSAPEPNIREIVKSLVRGGCRLNESANISGTMKSVGMVIEEDWLSSTKTYTPLDVAYSRGKNIIFVILLKSGCSVANFRRQRRHLASGEEDSTWLLITYMSKEKKRIKPLREMCRRTVVENLGGQAQLKVAKLPLSSHLKKYLSFLELEEIERTMGATALSVPRGDDRVAPQQQSAFSRNDSRRQTLGANFRHKGEKSVRKPSLPEPSWSDANVRNAAIYGTVRKKSGRTRSAGTNKTEENIKGNGHTISNTKTLPSKSRVAAGDASRSLYSPEPSQYNQNTPTHSSSRTSTIRKKTPRGIADMLYPPSTSPTEQSVADKNQPIPSSGRSKTARNLSPALEKSSPDGYCQQSNGDISGRSLPRDVHSRSAHQDTRYRPVPRDTSSRSVKDDIPHGSRTDDHPVTTEKVNTSKSLSVPSPASSAKHGVRSPTMTPSPTTRRSIEPIPERTSHNVISPKSPYSQHKVTSPVSPQPLQNGYRDQNIRDDSIPRAHATRGGSSSRTTGGIISPKSVYSGLYGSVSGSDQGDTIRSRSASSQNGRNDSGSSVTSKSAVSPGVTNGDQLLSPGGHILHSPDDAVFRFDQYSPDTSMHNDIIHHQRPNKSHRDSNKNHMRNGHTLSPGTESLHSGGSLSPISPESQTGSLLESPGLLSPDRVQSPSGSSGDGSIRNPRSRIPIPSPRLPQKSPTHGVNGKSSYGSSYGSNFQRSYSFR